MKKSALLTCAALVASALTVPIAAQASATSTTSTTSTAATAGTATNPAAGRAATRAPALKWGKCTDKSLTQAGAKCAMLKVPLDYAHPNGKQIKLAVSRVKHTVPAAQYQGVALTNPGGPGGAGLSLAVLGGWLPKGVGAMFDWIGFDPRGVGESKPAISCDKTYFGYDRPSYIPTSKKITRQWKATTKKYAADCAKKNGPILAHMTTEDSARDMDMIRRALGVPQISYYGFSYGTYLGQVYSTMYPTHVKRMVFDSTVDPRGVWYQSNLDQNRAFEKTERHWFRWVASYDSVYHLGKTGKAVRTLWFATRAQLDKTPVQAPGGKLGGSEWTDAFLNAGYYQSTWPDLADVFAGYIHGGDVKTLEATYLDANEYGDDNGYAAYLAVQCTDASWPTKWKTWQKDNWRSYAKAPFETWANAWYNYPCVTWPAPPSTPVTIDGSKVASLLLVDETLDAATPYSGSLQVRKLYPNSSLLALPGGTSHANTLYGNKCEDNLIAKYLATGKLPPRKAGNRADATCKPLPLPVPNS